MNMPVHMPAPAESPATLVEQAALDAAARGWHVFPAKIRGKQKYSHKKAEYSGGANWGATTDPEQIRRDCRRFGSPLLGVVTGPKSGFFVVEADTLDEHGVDGVAKLREWFDEHGKPDTTEALSPTGSWHLYFRWPDDLEIRNSAGQFKGAPGIDVRGEGGMVLAPPSYRADKGGSYRWIEGHAPWQAPVADCPDWLLTKLREIAAPERPLSERAAPSMPAASSGAYGDKALRDELATLLAAPEGTRNDALNRAAFNLAQLVAGGQQDEAYVRQRLTGAAEVMGLDAHEITATIASGFKAGFASPRGPKAASSAAPAENSLARFLGPGAGAVTGLPPAPAPVSAEPEPLFESVTSYKGKAIPPRRWLVEGLVPMNTVTLFGGDGGTGKSLLLMQLAVAAVRGTPWIGRGVTDDEVGPAMYLSAEDDDDELHRRFADVVRAEGIAWDDVAPLHRVSLAGRDALLAKLNRDGSLSETPLYDQLDTEMERHRPSVIMLDTLADLFPGNENDKAQARQFIGLLRRLAIRHQCAVVLLSHPSLSGMATGSGMAGNMAWNNSVRSRLYLERVTQDDGGKPYEADPDRRVLSTKKANYSRTGDEIRMSWRDGVFVADHVDGKIDRLAQEAHAERVFLRLLDEYTKEGRYVKSANAAGYAPKVFASSGRAEGLTKAALHSAMERLFSKDEIVEKLDGDGPPSKRTMRIVKS